MRSIGSSADLAAGPMTEAMPANTAATPAKISPSAANAKPSERAVTATATAATLSMRSPMAIHMIRTAIRTRRTRLTISGHEVRHLPQSLAVCGRHAVLVKHLAARSAPHSPPLAVLAQDQYRALLPVDVGAGYLQEKHDVRGICPASRAAL
jgi:hypothetical protein